MLYCTSWRTQDQGGQFITGIYFLDVFSENLNSRQQFVCVVAVVVAVVVYESYMFGLPVLSWVYGLLCKLSYSPCLGLNGLIMPFKVDPFLFVLALLVSILSSSIQYLWYLIFFGRHCVHWCKLYLERN